jgi:hypothetical protein
MNKAITLIAMLLMYLLPALTTPAYAENHAKDDTATTDADDKKKKKSGEEEEEPDCD